MLNAKSRLNMCHLLCSILNLYCELITYYNSTQPFKRFHFVFALCRCRLVDELQAEDGNPNYLFYQEGKHSKSERLKCSALLSTGGSVEKKVRLHGSMIGEQEWA